MDGSCRKCVLVEEAVFSTKPPLQFSAFFVACFSVWTSTKDALLRVVFLRGSSHCGEFARNAYEYVLIQWTTDTDLLVFICRLLFVHPWWVEGPAVWSPGCASRTFCIPSLDTFLLLLVGIFFEANWPQCCVHVATPVFTSSYLTVKSFIQTEVSGGSICPPRQFPLMKFYSSSLPLPLAFFGLLLPLGASFLRSYVILRTGSPGIPQ